MTKLSARGQLKKALVVAGVILATPVILVIVVLGTALAIFFPQLLAERRLMCEGRVVGESTRGPILRFTFRRRHLPRSEEMARYIEEAITTHRPAAVVLDLLKLRREFGDEFISVWPVLLQWSTKRERPFCVLAKGPTARNVRVLCEFAGFPEVAGMPFFKNLAEGLKYLEA